MQTIIIETDNETSKSVLALLRKIKGLSIEITELETFSDATEYVIAKPNLATRLKKYLTTQSLEKAVKFDNVEDAKVFFNQSEK